MPMITTNPRTEDRKLLAMTIRQAAVTVGGASTFAELAALALAKQFVKRGRSGDARRLLIAFLKQHAPTDAIVALLRALPLVGHGLRDDQPDVNAVVAARTSASVLEANTRL